MASLDDLVSNLKSGVQYIGQLVKVLQEKFPNWQTTVPLTSASPGTPGQVAYDATHFYVCVAPNTWARGTLAPF